MIEFLAQANPPIPQPSNAWEYGIALFVIVSSFAFIRHLVNIGLKKFKEQADANNATFEKLHEDYKTSIEKLHNEHRDERREWRAEAAERDKRLQTCLDRIMTALGRVDAS